MDVETTLWVFQDITVQQSIIIQVGTWTEPTVVKTWLDDTLLYVVDYQTYKNWNMWYSMKAKEQIIKTDCDKFKKVFVFDPCFYNELINLQV